MVQKVDLNYYLLYSALFLVKLILKTLLLDKKVSPFPKPTIYVSNNLFGKLSY
jgi:hypothetical protein